MCFRLFLSSFKDRQVTFFFTKVIKIDNTSKYAKNWHIYQRIIAKICLLQVRYNVFLQTNSPQQTTLLLIHLTKSSNKLSKRSPSSVTVGPISHRSLADAIKSQQIDVKPFDLAHHQSLSVWSSPTSRQLRAASQPQPISV